MPDSLNSDSPRTPVQAGAHQEASSPLLEQGSQLGVRHLQQSQSPQTPRLLRSSNAGNDLRSPRSLLGVSQASGIRPIRLQRPAGVPLLTIAALSGAGSTPNSVARPTGIQFGGRVGESASPQAGVSPEIESHARRVLVFDGDLFDDLYGIPPQLAMAPDASQNVMNEAVESIDIIPGEELKSLINPLKANPDRELFIRYVDDTGQAGIAIDDGGLTREALSEAMAQLRHESVAAGTFYTDEEGVRLGAFDDQSSLAEDHINAFDALGVLAVAYLNTELNFGDDWSDSFYQGLAGALRVIDGGYFGDNPNGELEPLFPLAGASVLVYMDTLISGKGEHELGLMLQAFDPSLTSDKLVGLDLDGLQSQCKSLVTPYIAVIAGIGRSPAYCSQMHQSPEVQANLLSDLKGPESIRQTMLEELEFFGNDDSVDLCMHYIVRFVSEASTQQLKDFLKLITGSPSIRPGQTLAIEVRDASDMPVVYVRGQAYPVNQTISTCARSLSINADLLKGELLPSYEDFIAAVIGDKVGFNTL